MNDRMMPDRDDVIARLEGLLGDHWNDLPDVALAPVSDALTLLRETWRPMSEAPRDGTPIKAQIPGHGADIVIAWNDGFLTHDEQPCCAWCVVEGQEPPGDWTDGVCWDSDERGLPSTQPTAWKPRPPLPKEEG